jgi:hypothetical protein
VLFEPGLRGSSISYICFFQNFGIVFYKCHFWVDILGVWYFTKEFCYDVICCRFCFEILCLQWFVMCLVTLPTFVIVTYFLLKSVFTSFSS